MVDILLLEEGCCGAGVMDSGVVHHKADFSIPNGGGVVDDGLEEGQEVV